MMKKLAEILHGIAAPTFNDQLPIKILPTKVWMDTHNTKPSDELINVLELLKSMTAPRVSFMMDASSGAIRQIKNDDMFIDSLPTEYMINRIKAARKAFDTADVLMPQIAYFCPCQHLKKQMNDATDALRYEFLESQSVPESCLSPKATTADEIRENYINGRTSKRFNLGDLENFFETVSKRHADLLKKETNIFEIEPTYNLKEITEKDGKQYEDGVLLSRKDRRKGKNHKQETNKFHS